MVIFEAPERVVQVVTYDNERGLKFVDVPAYNNFMKTRHVTDLEENRLTLQVFEEAKTCMIGKPRFHLKPKAGEGGDLQLHQGVQQQAHVLK